MQRIAYLLIATLLLFGCEKFKLKQPAFINFAWEFDNNCEHATVDNIKLYLSDFTVTGTRAEGDDVFMTKPIPETQISCSNNSALGVGIDIPVGDYETFILTLNIPKKTPALQINGTYFNGTEAIAVRIDWTEAIAVDFIATQKFSLKKKKSYDMKLGVNVNKLFENVSAGQWTNAQPSNENGVPTIVCSATSNPSIFNDINASVAEAVYIVTP